VTMAGVNAINAATPEPVINRLIGGLPRDDRKKLLDHCELVNIRFGDVLCEPDQPFPYAWFPVTGFVSLVKELNGHPPLEMGLIGNEGMVGTTLSLDLAAAPLRGVVQGAGTALRISIPELRRQLQKSPALQRTLFRYLYVIISQLSQTAACTHFHEIEQRLARWLLMSHDRAHADNFHLTHEFLAGMLGVRRSSITIAASAMQQRNLIQYTRGNICVMDRLGLEATACECYRAAVNDYERMLGQET